MEATEKMKLELPYRLCFVALVAVLSKSPVWAFEMNYGNLLGPRFKYVNLTERNLRNVSVFGSPDILGNDLDFDPVGLLARSSGNQGADSLRADLQFTFMTQPGIPELLPMRIATAGDFTISAIGPQEGLASIALIADVRITHTDGIPVDVPCLIPGLRPTIVPIGSYGSPYGGDYASPGDVGSAIPFAGMLELDFAALSRGCGYTGHVTSAEVLLYELLQTNSANGGAAFIAHKSNFDVVVVPEPTAVVCSLVLLAAVTGRRLRGSHSRCSLREQSLASKTTPWPCDRRIGHGPTRLRRLRLAAKRSRKTKSAVRCR